MGKEIQDSEVDFLAAKIGQQSPPSPVVARQSLRLLADKVVELDIVESISFKQVRITLKNEVQPQVVHWKITAEFIARWESILRLYLLAYDEQYPVICFDWRYGQDMQPGQVAKENYAYSKDGSYCVLATIAPLTGQGFVHIRGRRRTQAFALFIQELVKQNTDRLG